MAIFEDKQNEPLDAYLGRGCVVEGTVRFKELLRVDGKITGKVISEKDLVVGEAGVVEAEIQIGTLSVAGQVTGTIRVQDRIEIHPGGRVSGELHLKGPRLVIEEGGILEGKVEMGDLTGTKALREVEPTPETGKVKGFTARRDTPSH